MTKLEFASAVWKKVRVKDLTQEQAAFLLEAFESDFQNYSFVQLDTFLLEKANHLLSVYGEKGLRTLDSLQLATAVLLKDQLQMAISSDNLLLDFFGKEGLPV